METKRKGVSVSLPTDIIDVLNKNAESDGRNTSRYLEAVLMDYFKIKPKPLRKPVKLSVDSSPKVVASVSKKTSKATQPAKNTPVKRTSKMGAK
jgi:hypothetical protein